MAGKRAFLGISLVVVITAIGVAVMLARTAKAKATPASSVPAAHRSVPAECGLAWRVVPSPNATTGNNRFMGIAAISENDVWAVGYYSHTNSTYNYTLIEHWDGTQWTIMPSPYPSADTLVDVSASASNDVWAVGNYNNGSPLLNTWHWNGSQWINVPNPNPGSNYAENLSAVEAVSTNDAWAVGFYRQNSPQALIMHWNGSSWSVSPNPPGSGIISLSGVSTITANDVWAVGGDISQSGSPSVTFHWNGSAWSQVPVPNTGGLSDVSGVASNDVWATGGYVSGTNHILHWDGVAWSVVPHPVTTGMSVKAIASDNVWAVGRDILHWDGSQWAMILTTPGGLSDISATSATDIWAAGSYINGGVYQTFIEHYSDAGPCATATPTVTATPTSTPQALLVGHVTWQGRPAQPDPLQQVPITLTLRAGSTPVNYPAQNTDPSGYFTVTVNGLPPGSYDWWVKDPKYLANAGLVLLPGSGTTQADMGMMKVGDANNDNLVAIADFIILKGTFGKGQGDPGYDDRADFTGDHLVNAPDFNLLRANFGLSGTPPLVPGG